MSGGLDPLWLGASISMEHWHFHRRLFDRYGIVLRPGEFSWVLKKIKDGRALVVENRRDGESIVCIRLRDTRERVYILVRGSRNITLGRRLPM